MYDAQRQRADGDPAGYERFGWSSRDLLNPEHHVSEESRPYDPDSGLDHDGTLEGYIEDAEAYQAWLDLELEARLAAQIAARKAYLAAQERLAASRRRPVRDTYDFKLHIYVWSRLSIDGIHELSPLRLRARAHNRATTIIARAVPIMTTEEVDCTRLD
jgi:hypothetical protein